MIFEIPLFLLVLASSVAAYPQITTPAAGATLTGGSTITVEWKDSGDSPSISDLTSYQLFLCAGGNDAGTYTQLATLTTTGTFAGANSAAGMVQAGVGASTPKNAYFLQMIATATAGGTVTIFSSRFSLSGMTGAFTGAALTGVGSISGTSGPDTINAVANGANGGATQAVDASAYDVPYTLQTGLTKFAPMQPVPPTKISKNKATPLYPTSALTIATTFLPIPKQLTTMTMSQTFKVSSMENTAAAAPMPSDDMAKFLARWKD